MSTEFVRKHLRLAPVAHVPEIQLYQTAEAIGLWELTEATFAPHCHDGTKPPGCPYRDHDDEPRSTGESP